MTAIDMQRVCNKIMFVCLPTYPHSACLHAHPYKIVICPLWHMMHSKQKFNTLQIWKGVWRS